MNICLLCGWWWKLETGEGLWQTIVRRKYVKQDTLPQLKWKSSNSPVWNGLLKVKELYLRGRVMRIGNARYVWSIIAMVLGTNCRPSSLDQYWIWWASLQKPEDKENLEAGADALKDAALHFHPLEATPEDNEVVLIQ
uniref:Uncharacterized protein n=1 Tax=Setaria italica TaxID=4555 RepID=K3ZE32_SETIT